MLSGRLISVQPHPRLKLMKLIISLFFFAICTLFFVVPNVEAAETLNFVHQDHLGSTSLVTDSTGKVVSKQTYYPYGNTRSQSSVVSSQLTERQYTSQVSDQDQTGLYYYNARYYNPQIAKFSQPDNIDYGLNRYRYVNNNPLNYTDPSGNTPKVSGLHVPGPLYWKPEMFGRKEIKEEDLSQIALTVFSETNNASTPAEVMEIIAWVYINRFTGGELTIYDSGFGILMDRWKKALDPYLSSMYIKPAMTNEELAATALSLCYQNSQGCPVMSKAYDLAYNTVKDVYKNYIQLGQDVTQGSLFFVHEGKLQRNAPGGNIVFDNISQLKNWVASNLEYAQKYTPDFVGFVSDVYNNTFLSVTKGQYIDNSQYFLMYGNNPCIWSTTCGLDRPYAEKTNSGATGVLPVNWITSD